MDVHPIGVTCLHQRVPLSGPGSLLDAPLTSLIVESRASGARGRTERHPQITADTDARLSTVGSRELVTNFLARAS